MYKHEGVGRFVPGLIMMDDIEQAIDEELMKLNLHPSENDSESDDDNFTVLDGNLHAENELPDSVLTYVEASRNRMNTFEQLILEDVEEKDFSSQNLSHLNHNEPASVFTDDPMKWKDRVISELVEQVGHLNDIEPQNAQWEIPNMSGMEDYICPESELQLSLEWRELEKRLREEEEQKLAAQEVERELHQNSEREEEERRRRGRMKFQEELKKIEEATW
ncbi:leucine-rich repeat and IQ domain-containing protein 1-like, partial [Sinocyclocheilus grahami]|uniref:leucine-rich repeat and IQ domain-containing protein 1-like n=1 Tax=Sinocyclocheilus grahami TaxID=75366 RepID=UPI0007AD0866